MIQSCIKKKILEKAVSLEKFGMNDLAWEKDAAVTLINSLMNDDIGILGGSVYKIDSNNFMPMYDNWSCNPDSKEVSKDFNFRSKTRALEYINKYPIYLDERILFSLVFTEDVD
ncbi:Imm40 family immunity protein [Estrella lausannensis]|uniref:Immunity protein 40 domain-containing protein n=1 Tax=Estrella lausannensis TaxID=483423 RepID=A0A0H5DSF0_9BACT|nr:Imm40 family immunity protein [Estrella lausannensis]CRX38694.1 conserved hypothetical protein [Estrella lausannensis]